MESRNRKRLFNSIRVVICVLACWLVVRGVTIHDHVVLSSGEELVGNVRESGSTVVVTLADGAERTVPLSAIALNERNKPLISYGIKTSWRNSTKWLLLLALAMHFPVAFFQAIRLQWLLRVQDIRIAYWECVKFTFAGNFLNYVTPLGSNAGDVFKAYFVTKHTRHKTEAITTIALDRIIGLGTLIVCVAAITTFSAAGGRLAEFRPYVLSILGIGIALSLAYLSPVLRKRLIPRRWIERLPIFDQLQRIDRATHAVATHKPTIVASVLITITLQVLAIGAYFVVAVALSLNANLGNMLEYYAYFYTGAVIQALPGPPQGLGTVELAYCYFLAPFGSQSQILSVAFVVRLVVLTCSLPGLLVTMTGSYKPQATDTESDAANAAANVQAIPKHDLATT